MPGKVAAFWAAPFYPQKIKQDLPKRIGAKNSFPGNVNPDLFKL